MAVKPKVTLKPNSNQEEQQAVEFRLLSVFDHDILPGYIIYI